MFRTDQFKIGKPMFAVNLDAYSIGDGADPTKAHTCSIAAVWFRRKRANYNGPMRTAACGGYLSRVVVRGPAPADGTDMLVKPAMFDHRADCIARWDGHTLWSLEDEASRAKYLELLVPMLAAYPAVPQGYSGWWWNG